MKKKFSPQTATTFSKICSLDTDNHSTKNYWIIIDEVSVTLAEQQSGKPANTSISITRKDFNKLIEWYQTPQKFNNRK